jgi:hypothetical protein
MTACGCSHRCPANQSAAQIDLTPAGGQRVPFRQPMLFLPGYLLRPETSAAGLLQAAALTDIPAASQTVTARARKTICGAGAGRCPCIRVRHLPFPRSFPFLSPFSLPALASRAAPPGKSARRGPRREAGRITPGQGHRHSSRVTAREADHAGRGGWQTPDRSRPAPDRAFPGNNGAPERKPPLPRKLVRKLPGMEAKAVDGRRKPR